MILIFLRKVTLFTKSSKILEGEKKRTNQARNEPITTHRINLLQLAVVPFLKVRIYIVSLEQYIIYWQLYSSNTQYVNYKEIRQFFFFEKEESIIIYKT